MAEFWGPVMLNVAALAAVAVAVALLALHARHRPTRVFAYMLLLGGGATLINYGFRAVGGDLQATGAAAAPYFYIPGPFLMVYFASVYPRPRTWLGKSRWGGWLTLAVCLGLEALYAWDHALWTRGPLVLTVQLGLLATAGVGLVFTRDYLRGEHGVVPGALLLMIVGFTLDAGYSSVRDITQVAIGFYPLTATRLLWGLAAIPYVGMIALLARRLRAEPDAAARRALRRTTALLALGPAFAVVVSVAIGALGASFNELIAGVPAASISLVGTGVIAYALLRHRLFDIDLKVKRGIRDGTVVASFAAALVLAREGVQVVLPGDVATLVGIAATGTLVLAFTRVRRFGERVAEGALPQVSPSPEFLNARKVEVYRAALEEALARDGELPSQEATRLASLRSELGLSERDHALLTFAVRSARMPWRPRLLEPGALVLGRYRVERQLGQGANGTTFLARDEANGGGRVALKALRPERGGDPATIREARAMQAVKHPNVVAMREVADAGDQVVIVMEYMEGGSLADRLAEGPLGPDDFRRLSRDLLQALGAVHEAGTVHRDVKPSNVLLAADGTAKLADFGIAQVEGFETTVGGGAGDLGTAIGTFRFVSPEQARGRRVTVRSDLFSAAATLFEASTGKPYLAPLPGESAVELQMRAAAGQPFPRGFKGPPGLRAWFAKALDPLPERRFRTAEEMLQGLDRALLTRARSSAASGRAR
ncbi:MAG TPA: serine/threonine-protein kinase [Candidatus Thermoplasmatota archaeon]|jgi:hypothetical protein|nr:serine/threonine-protein kinase [Candidatus Thermoplasmatota archaeon]